MDSFEWNKIFMGVGFSALAILGINELSGALYHVETPAEPGYVVAGVEATTTAAGGGETTAAALPDFGTLLPAADLAAGEKVAAKCTQCHTWDKGGANKIGPNLYGIVGANHAHLGEAFAYSPAMKAKSGEVWDFAALYVYLKNPAKAVPGTKMAFAGLSKSEDRINLIAFLRMQSDSPLAIPAPAPAGAPPTEGAAPAPEGGTPAAPEGGAPPTTPTDPANVPEAPPPGEDGKPADPPVNEGGTPAQPPPAEGEPAPTTPPASGEPTPPAPAGEPASTEPSAAPSSAPAEEPPPAPESEPPPAPATPPAHEGSESSGG